MGSRKAVREIESMSAAINGMSGPMLQMKLDMIEKDLVASRPDNTLEDVVSDTGIDPSDRAIILAGRLDGPASRRLALRIADRVSDAVGGRKGRKVRLMIRLMSDALGPGEAPKWKRKLMIRRALRARRRLARTWFVPASKEESAAMTASLMACDPSASDLLAVHYAFDNASAITGPEELLMEMKRWM